LIGADLMNFDKLADLNAPIASIGGARERSTASFSRALPQY